MFQRASQARFLCLPDRAWPPHTPCGSEPARDKPEYAAGCQAVSVIVDDHREQARSYRLMRKFASPIWRLNGACLTVVSVT